MASGMTAASQPIQNRVCNTSLVKIINMHVIYILKSEASACATMCRYFLAPCDEHKHTGHAQQQAASQASTDSACGHPVWLPHSSVGFQHPVGHRSYNNKPRLTGEVCVTPQATIALVSLTDGRDKGPTADFSKLHKTRITVERVSKTNDLRYKLVKKMQQVSVDELNIRV